MYQKCKESSQLLFLIGDIFEYKFNAEGLHSQSQRCILFDLPTQDNLNKFKKIKVLLDPPGCKEVIYEPGKSKQL